MRGTRWHWHVRALLVVACGVTAWALAPGAALATHVQCGDVITASTTLDSDLIDCPGDGIQIRGQDITLDLGGHVVDGTATEFTTGITTLGGSVRSNNVVVRNGTVQQFDRGVRLASGNGQLAERLVVRDNTLTGVSLIGSRDSTVRKLTAFGNSTALLLSDVRRILVTDNRLFSNGSAIFGGLTYETVIEKNNIFANEFGAIGFNSIFDSRISDNNIRDNGGSGIRFLDFSEHNLLVDNKITRSAADGITIDDFTGPNTIERNNTNHNGDDGIDVDYPGSTLTRNKANHNGDLGIEAVPGTIDGGKNQAKGNGNPAQCTGVTCK